MTEIALPRAGMTLLPPWWAFVLWAGKRTENRSAFVAQRIGTWRGLVALGASKHCDRSLAEEIADSYRREPFYDWRGQDRFTMGEVFARGGHIVGVADLLDVRPNGPHPSDPWAEPGEHGLILGRVWEVDPVPCSGGRGVCAIGACARCLHVGSIEERGAPLVCRKCKATTPRAELRRPLLRVRRCFGPDGAPLEVAA